MPHKNRPKNTRKATAKVEQPPSQTNRQIWLRRLFWSPWTITTVVATVAGCLSALPHLSASPTSSLRSADPLSMIFLLSNDGMLPIHDIDWSGKITKLDCCNGASQMMGASTIIAPGLPSESIKILLPSHKAAFPFRNHFRIENIDHLSAEISLSVVYRPDFYPSVLPRWHEDFRFKTEEDEKGQYVWVPQ